MIQLGSFMAFINDRLRELRNKPCPRIVDTINIYKSAFEILGYKDKDLNSFLYTFLSIRENLSIIDRLLLDDLIYSVSNTRSWYHDG